MDKEKTSLERSLLLGTGLLGLVSGLFAAALGLFKNLKELVGVFSDFGDWQLWAAGLAVRDAIDVGDECLRQRSMPTRRRRRSSAPRTSTPRPRPRKCPWWV